MTGSRALPPWSKVSSGPRTAAQALPFAAVTIRFLVLAPPVCVGSQWPWSLMSLCKLGAQPSKVMGFLRRRPGSSPWLVSSVMLHPDPQGIHGDAQVKIRTLQPGGSPGGRAGCRPSGVDLERHDIGQGGPPFTRISFFFLYHQKTSPVRPSWHCYGPRMMP